MDEQHVAICPFCGLEARRLSHVEGTIWRYRCPKCKKVFLVDEATGTVIG